MNKLLLHLLFPFFLWNCSSSPVTEKHQHKRDREINVHEKVKELVIEDVLIGRLNHLFLTDNYLIIGDYKSQEKQIHLFDKNDFHYLASTGDKGQGPNEIANMGFIGVNNTDNQIYVSDHGKQKIFSFDIDSILTNPDYLPKEKVKLDEFLFPNKYVYISDTLCIGLVIERSGKGDFTPVVAKWNMLTGEIHPMPYKHPKIEKKRISYAVSTENRLYVECYLHHDLMSIFTIEGELLFNIYGSKWDNTKSNENTHYGDVQFCGNKIIALYLGKKQFYNEKNGATKVDYPTMFHVFDLNGNYLKTLDTGYKITSFCYDKENHRLIMSLDDDIQFAYLDISGLID